MINEIFNSMETLVSFIIERNAKEIPNVSAIIYDDKELSYLELKNTIDNLVLFFNKEKIPKNICVGLRFKNEMNYCIFHLALFKMGIAQATINSKDNDNIQLMSASNMGIDLIIQDFPLDNILLKQTIYVDDNLNIQKNIFRELKENKNLPKNTSVIFLGSGTTDKEKLITLNSSLLATELKKSIHYFRGNPKEIFFCYSKIYYPYTRRSLLFVLFKGMTFLLYKSNINIISFCIEKKVDHMQLTADQVTNILLQNCNTTNSILLPNLKSCSVSSSLISEPLRKKILSSITKNLYIVYGTNEFGIISEATPEDINAHPGTVGKALSDVNLKIIDDNGKECKTNEIGNIVVKYSNSNELINNQGFTNKTFIKDYYYTGDLGKLTEDGNLIFEGRKDDMMIFSGVNIYPRELESVLESHPNVIESAVFPLTINEQYGVPFAVVIVNKPISEKELLKWCSEKIGWKRPQRIFFIKEFPKNNVGKVIKRVLQQQVISMLVRK